MLYDQLTVNHYFVKKANSLTLGLLINNCRTDIFCGKSNSFEELFILLCFQVTKAYATLVLMSIKKIYNSMFLQTKNVGT